MLANCCKPASRDRGVGKQQPLEFGQGQQLLHSLVGHFCLREIQYPQVAEPGDRVQAAVRYFRAGEVQCLQIRQAAKIGPCPCRSPACWSSTNEVSDFRPDKYLKWSSRMSQLLAMIVPMRNSRAVSFERLVSIFAAFVVDGW